MPLELQEPTFDRQFDDLYRELRDRIPRYNPLWTDFNDSDPGITLVQLFAWLAELTWHQMGQVPRKNYFKFARLLGLELGPARPATVRLAFTAKEGERPATIPAGSRYTAAGDEGAVMFETVEDLDIIGAPLDATVVFSDGLPVKIEPPAIGAPGPFYPFGRYPEPGNALYLGFKPSPNNLEPFPRKMRFLALRPETVTTGEPQKVGDRPADLEPPVELAWEFRPKRGQNVWERLRVLRDDTVAFLRDGYLDVEGPGEIEPSVEPAVAALVNEERYWLRVRLADRSYPRAPQLQYLLPNAIDAMSLVTEAERSVGQSAGTAGQVFEFPQRPVDPRSLVLVVRPAAGVEETWVRKDDLLASRKDDAHFVLDATAGRVRFGDGANGRIPPAGADIVATRWRYGGGRAANDVTADGVTTMVTQIAGVERVTNPRPPAGGADEETVEDFLKRAPAVLRGRGRAVTADDFANLAREVDGVAGALARPGRHPDYPDVEVPGAVTVLIVPDEDRPKSDRTPPAPSAELIQAVSRHLEPFRLITTEVYVTGPRYLELRIEARLYAAPEAAFDKVADEVIQRLDKYLDPRTWQFGRDVSLSEIYRELLGSPDPKNQVRSVANLMVYVDRVIHEVRGPIRVPPDALVYPGQHLIIVRPDPDRPSS